MGPILDPLGAPFGSLLDPKIAETSLEISPRAAKSRPNYFLFGPGGLHECSKRSPRALQEASMRLRRSKKGSRALWGAFFTPPGPLWTSKTGAPGACQEHSARYSRAFRGILNQACFIKSFPSYCKTIRPRPPAHNASRGPPGAHPSTCQSRPQRDGRRCLAVGVLDNSPMSCF